MNKLENYKNDDVLNFVIKAAKKKISPCKVYLFGSKARGDDHTRSDYDIAFKTEEVSHADWADFANFVRENLPTIHSIDLIWLNEAQSDIKKQVEQDGVLLDDIPRQDNHA